jgi:peptidoglycan/xylan/chitin deacetylase (PgdA/CDA1 family)
MPLVPLIRLHKFLRTRFPTALWHGRTDRREIALTFDDGPDPDATSELLALLDHYSIRATFFHVGKRAARHPHLVQEVAAAGHQIGVHGYRHRSFFLTSQSTLLDEVTRTQHLLASLAGRDPSTINAVRPPFGHFKPSQLATLLDAGYLPVMWSVVPFHWRQSPENTVRQVMQESSSGTILVLHEAMYGPPVTEIAATLLPLLIDQGYHFVTIEEMWTALQQAQAAT